MTVVDPKQIRVACPTCAYPLMLTVTSCHICGALIDPHVQFESYERNVTVTVTDGPSVSGEVVQYR